MVSPPGKTSGSVLYYQMGAQGVGDGQSPMQATPVPAVEGDGVVYSGEQFFESLTGTYTEYLSRLEGDVWSTHDLSSLGETDEEYRLVASAAGLSRFAVSVEGDIALDYRNILLEDASGGLSQPLIGAAVAHLRAPLEFGESSKDGSERNAARFKFVPASRDFSRVFFSADDALLSGSEPLEKELAGAVSAEIAASPSEQGGYLYESREGVLSLASILPDGRVAHNAEFGFSYPEERDGDLEHVVSEDGLRVFWTGSEPGSGEQNLYLRERPRGHEGEPRTVKVAAGGEFLGASPDGSRVFYLGAGGDALDEYDVVTAETTVIAGEGMGVAGIEGGGGGGAGEYGGLLGTGGDGEYVYFVDHAKLTGEQANAQGEKAQAERYNMYLYEPDGAGGHVVRFIATLERLDDLPPFGVHGTELLPSDSLGVWARTPLGRTSEVSPDGRFVAFGSHLGLTGVSNGGPEVFVFDASSGVLSCASCDPSGASNAGAVLPPLINGDGLREQRYMLDSGALFFTTPSALLPEDGNSVDDVYEWREGRLQLISPGDGEDPAVLADVSEDGSNVFFTTPESIVTQDADGLADLYDARVDGGRPAVTAPAGCAALESCRGAPGGPPAFQAPSSTASGASGNLAPPPVTATGPKPKTAAQIRAEKLTKALKACRRKRPGRKRTLCERQARKQYGAKTSSRSSRGGK